MSSEHLFRGALNLYQIMGFPLDYAKGIKGYLMQLLAIFTYFSVATNLVYHFYYLCVKVHNIDELTTVVAFCLTNTENIVILTTFYLWRAEFKFLINRTCEIVKEGNFEQNFFGPSNFQFEILKLFRKTTRRAENCKIC